MFWLFPAPRAVLLIMLVARRVMRARIRGLQTKDVASAEGLTRTVASSLFRAVRDHLEDSLRWSWDGLDDVGANIRKRAA